MYGVLPSHRVPEAGSRDSIIWSGRGGGKDKESTGAKEADKKIEGGGG